jgi:hypothetical protein
MREWQYKVKLAYSGAWQYWSFNAVIFWQHKYKYILQPNLAVQILTFYSYYGRH